VATAWLISAVIIAIASPGHRTFRDLATDVRRYDAGVVDDDIEPDD
jgi:hypothetical protein